MNMPKSRLMFSIVILLFGLAACNQSGNEDTEQLQVQVEAYLNVGNIYRTQGQFRSAVIETQNALQILPNYPQSRVFAAQLYIDIGDFVEAAAVLNNLLESDPENIEARVLLAEANVNMGEAESALANLETIQPTDPGMTNRVNWLRGNASAGLGDRPAADSAFQAILANDPEHLDTLISLSKLEYRDGNIEASNDYMERAVAADPGYLDLLIWQGQYALLQQNYPQAEESLLAALDIMGNYDTMTSKRFAALQTVLIPLQMQQKNDEALRYSEIIAATPQGQFQNAYTDAVAFFESGNFTEAENALNAILTSSPDHQGSNLLLGMTQYAQGNYTEALESFSGISNIESTSPEIIRTLVATHLRLQQPERALEILNQSVTRYPEDAALLAMLGVTQQSLGDVDTSVETFTKALELQPESAEIHFALASSYFQLENVTEAISSLQETLRIAPAFAAAKTSLVDIYLGQQNFELARESVQTWLNEDPGSTLNSNLAGRVAFTEGNFAEARQFFDSSIRVNSADVLSRLFLARIDIEDQNFEAARDGFMAVLETEPNNLEALTGLLAIGNASDSVADRIADVQSIIDRNSADFAPPLVLSQFYLSEGEFTNALQFAQVALTRNDNQFTRNTVIEIMLRQINTARQARDFELAGNILNEALALDEESIPLLTAATGLANDRGNTSEAEAYIERIQLLQPDSAFSYEIEGDLSLAQNDLNAALESFQRAWSMQKSTSTGIKLHQTLSALERPQDAAQLLEEWLEATPEDGAANLLKAMTLQQEGQDAQAIDHYEIAIQTQPDNMILLNNLAWLYQDSQPARALELAARAAELFPEIPDVLDTYGWILHKQGNSQLAIETLQKALELSPDSEAIAEHLREVSQ